MKSGVLYMTRYLLKFNLLREGRVAGGGDIPQRTEVYTSPLHDATDFYLIGTFI